MARPYWEKPPLPTRPRPVWWRRLLCSALTHNIVTGGQGTTARCLRCKDSWP